MMVLAGWEGSDSGHGGDAQARFPVPHHGSFCDWLILGTATPAAATAAAVVSAGYLVRETHRPGLMLPRVGPSPFGPRVLARTAALVLGYSQLGDGTPLPTTLPTATTSIDYSFWITYMGYTGSIPTEYGAMTALSYLDISYSGLSGPGLSGNIPSQVSCVRLWQSLSVFYSPTKSKTHIHYITAHTNPPCTMRNIRTSSTVAGAT